MKRREFNIAAISLLVASAVPGFAQEGPSVTEMALGPEDAKVTIIEYASYTCPHCARFHTDQYKQLKADYIDTDKIRFVYRDVYFDRYGLWASMVARCGGPEKFFGVNDLIYTQQSEWLADRNDPTIVADNLRRIGRVAGLDEAALDACMKDEAMAQKLVEVYQETTEADAVRSTPTLMINGVKHENMAYSALKAIIEERLAE